MFQGEHIAGVAGGVWFAGCFVPGGVLWDRAALGFFQGTLGPSAALIRLSPSARGGLPAGYWGLRGPVAVPCERAYHSRVCRVLWEERFGESRVAAACWRESINEIHDPSRLQSLYRCHHAEATSQGPEHRRFSIGLGLVFTVLEGWISTNATARKTDLSWC
ncbi:hypothetical protein F5884DRAFT_180729 [Xylogone sp. PMI_703]|nr:hypothetical protein F5884DRAFT_180729 [Xylogone sp. PMI_703]